MRARLSHLALAAALLAPLAPSRLAAANDPRLDKVVAKVGDASVTVGDLERRMRAIPRFQLATFGTTAEEISRRFLEKVIVPELLISAGAKERKLDETPGVRARIHDALRTARLAALRAETATNAAVTPEQVQKYYDDNKARFDTPERVSVWRILCKSKKEAEEVIAEAKKAGSPARWAELAREHSVDATTSMRAGNLGFLSPEGVSTDQGVQVMPELVAAAAKLKDGDIGEAPVAEGDKFAVLWRRGSMPAVKRSVEQEQVAIRQVLSRQRIEAATKGLVDALRAARLKQYEPALLDSFDIDPRGNLGPKGSASAAASARALPQPPRKPAGSPAPSGAPGTLR